MKININKLNINKINPDYIYLIQLREFIKTGENIYKFGRTQQENFKRFYQYPKNSKLIFQIICNDSKVLEHKILIKFRQKYISRKDIGAEYFEGDHTEMINDIFDVIKNGSH